MKPRFGLAFALALAGCAAAEPPPAGAPVNTATPAPGPPSGSSTPMSSPCPTDVQAATGKACSMEGEACGDPARSGFGIICRSGTWQTGEMPHPPCCKK